MKLAIDRLLSLQALAYVAQGKDSADAATIGSAIARLEPLKNTYTLPDTLWPSADKIMSDAQTQPIVDPAGPTATVTESPSGNLDQVPGGDVAGVGSAGVGDTAPSVPSADVAPGDTVGSEQPVQPPAAVVEGDAAPTPVTELAPVADVVASGTQPAEEVDPTPADKETIASLDARLDKLEKKQ